MQTSRANEQREEMREMETQKTTYYGTMGVWHACKGDSRKRKQGTGMIVQQS